MKCHLHPQGHPPYTGPQVGRWRMNEKSRRFYCQAYCGRGMKIRKDKEREKILEQSYIQRFGKRKGLHILAILKG